MKLIIDIPESEYMEIKRYYDNLPMYSTVEAELYYIAHGTPLNSVKAEIQAKEMIETEVAKEFYNMALDDVIDILDNIDKESE